MRYATARDHLPRNWGGGVPEKGRGAVGGEVGAGAAEADAADGGAVGGPLRHRAAGPQVEDEDDADVHRQRRVLLRGAAARGAAGGGVPAVEGRGIGERVPRQAETRREALRGFKCCPKTVSLVVFSPN